WPGRVRTAPSQHEHAGPGQRIEDPRREDHVRKELLEATRGREPDGPGRAHEHREGRRAEARVNLRQLPEEDSVPGHRVVHPGVVAREPVRSTENLTEQGGYDQLT